MYNRFYIAGSMNATVHCRGAVDFLERETDLTCTSRWIKGRSPEVSARECAQEDIDDIKDADVVIMLTGTPSSSGGLWVELGICIALEKPVIVVQECVANPEPVFLSLQGIMVLRTLEELLLNLDE